jgi:hypothetical protein
MTRPTHRPITQVHQVSHEQQAMKGYLIDGLVMLFSAAVIGISLAWFRLDITVTIVLLVGVWVVDGFLKKTYGFTGETLFADLSFSAFIFAGSQTVGAIAANASTGQNAAAITRLGVISFILSLIWLGNLRMCRGLTPTQSTTREATRHYQTLWVVSLVFGAISTSIALLPQVIGLI